MWCVAGPYAISRAIGQLSASEIPVPSLGSLRQVLVRQKLGHEGAERHVANYLLGFALEFEVFSQGTLGVDISRLISRQGGLPGRIVFMCSTVLRGCRRMDSPLNRSDLSNRGTSE